jgi:GNAT superfamily N-acetyltransferase
MTLRAVPASLEHSAGLMRLFERCSCTCFCRYWHFDGDKNAWLDRLANHPQDSATEMLAALQARSDEMSGVVALAGLEVIGWMKLSPAPAVGKLYAQRLYRGLPCFSGDRAGVLTVGCFLVDPDFRRRHVAELLLAEGMAIGRGSGARAIEAFPRRAEGVSDAELWMGPLEAFERAGFAEVHGFRPYPVLRIEL